MHYSKDHLKRFAYPPHRNIFWAELFVLRIWSNVSEVTRVQDYITEKAMDDCVLEQMLAQPHNCAES